MKLGQRAGEGAAGDFFAPVSRGIESSAQAIHELLPLFRQYRFNECADALQERLDAFDREATPPQVFAGKNSAQVREEIDASASALAGMFKTISKHIGKARYGEHLELLNALHTMARDFDRQVAPKLKLAGLEYHEFTSLLLQTEATLAVDEPAPVRSIPKDRRRRMPKDPDKIEEKLQECLEIAIGLRERILNPDKQA